RPRHARPGARRRHGPRASAADPDARAHGARAVRANRPATLRPARARSHLVGRPRCSQPGSHRGGGAPRGCERAFQPAVPGRGGFMLIALPNTDDSFTATLFLARAGAVSFAALARPPAVAEFFDRQFADVVPLMPDLLAEFASHPQGQLGTVHASAWQVAGRVLLLGDAAHAIVPFHGQGMNAAFEDCAVLDALLERQADWPTVFAQFEQSRRPNAAAIAQMALE